MPRADFAFSLSPDQISELYRGARVCHAISVQGLRIEFPAMALRPYVTHAGVHGQFRLDYSPSGKFQRLIQLNRKN